jgi:hypothetical protein
LENIRLLRRYSRLAIEPHHHIMCREFFSHRDSIPLRELEHLFDSNGGDFRIPYALLYWGVLSLNLESELDGQAPIWLPESANGGT